MKILTLLFLLVLVLAAYEDSDMDGVEDKSDRCPNTLFTDLVGNDGCSIESLVSPHHFDIVTGVSYSDTDYNTLSKIDTLTTSIKLDYYYKNFSFILSTAIYNNTSETYNDSGLNDTFIGVNYQYIYKKLYMSLGLGVLLPTYKTALNNNNSDYTVNINLSYELEKLNLFGVYGYTLINDKDVVDIAYKNTNYFSLGAGYNIHPSLYLSAYYNKSDSMYKGVQSIKTFSVYSYYSFNENYFATLNYSYGLSEPASDNYVSLKIGYYY